MPFDRPKTGTSLIGTSARSRSVGPASSATGQARRCGSLRLGQARIRSASRIVRLLSSRTAIKRGAAAYDRRAASSSLRVGPHRSGSGWLLCPVQPPSSRDQENNGDGPALALEAGASLMDMEFVQFHPTGMVGDRYGEDWDGRLVTEAVRGEGVDYSR